LKRENSKLKLLETDADSLIKEIDELNKRVQELENNQ